MHIALVGDRSDKIRSHLSIPRALELAAAGTVDVRHTWVPSDGPMELTSFDAVWVIPGGPYASMAGMLEAIRFARVHNVPLLGTCGGFQMAAIEYARAVLGLSRADHAEENPSAELKLVAPLACSLVGKHGHVSLRQGSRLRDIYGVDDATESYFCSYGVDPAQQAQLDGGPMHIAAVDDAGDIRAMELAGHRFFIATLFQPELSAATGRAHPLISAFVRT